LYEYLENIIIFTDKYYLSRTRILLENLYTLSVKDNYSLDKLCPFINNRNIGKHSILLGICYRINCTHIGNTKYDNRNKSVYLGILISEQGYKIVGVARQIIAIPVRWLNENLGIENMLLGVENNNTHALRIHQNLLLSVSK
jgi:hypothetical protein